MTNETQSSNLIVRTRRSRRPGWLQILNTPIVEITQADIMRDLDPSWNATGFDNHIQAGGSR